MTLHCPDCLAPVGARKRAHDGRCDACRPDNRHSEERAWRVADSRRRRDANDRPLHYWT